jgi:hypothetical protein
MSDFVAETTARVDKMLAHAERNGWNGAINAARLLLPVEYSRKISALYKREAAAALIAEERTK